MCEKQIVVPNNSILYCSERYLTPTHPPPIPCFPKLIPFPPSCRRKDCSPAPTSNPYIATMSPTLSPYTSFGADLTDPLGPKVKELIPRLQPTVLPPPSSTRIPTLAPDFRSDLDPTEWKPKLQSRPSDAYQYLSLFHADNNASVPPRRPILPSRSRTATTTPSLSHSPSLGSSREVSPVGTPYEFVARPLASRLDGASAHKSVDAVTPLTYAFAVSSLSEHGVGDGKVGGAKKGAWKAEKGLAGLMRGGEKGEGTV